MWTIDQDRLHLDADDRRFLRVATRYFLVVVALALLVIGLAVNRSLRLNQLYMAEQSAEQRATMAKAGFATSDNLIAAASHLAEERGLVYAALVTGRDVAGGRPVALGAAREAGARLDQALSTVAATFDGASISAAQARARLEQERLVALRQQIAAQLATEPRRPDPSLARAWFRQATRQLGAIETLMDNVHGEMTRLDTRVESAMLLQLQRLALGLAVAAGQKRAVLSSAIAVQAPLPVRVPQMALSHGDRSFEHKWHELAQLVEQVASPELAAHLGDLDRIYLADVRSKRRQLEQASLDGKPYPITSDAWFKSMSAAVDGLLGLARTAGRLAQESTLARLS